MGSTSSIANGLNLLWEPRADPARSLEECPRLRASPLLVRANHDVLHTGATGLVSASIASSKLFGEPLSTVVASERMLDFGQFDFGQFDFGQLAEIELAEVEIGRSRNWPKSKLIGRSRN